MKQYNRLWLILRVCEAIQQVMVGYCLAKGGAEFSFTSIDTTAHSQTDLQITQIMARGVQDLSIFSTRPSLSLIRSFSGIWFCIN